jgi:hypothetical protein
VVEDTQKGDLWQVCPEEKIEEDEQTEQNGRQ